MHQGRERERRGGFPAAPEAGREHASAGEFGHQCDIAGVGRRIVQVITPVASEVLPAIRRADIATACAYDRILLSLVQGRANAKGECSAQRT